MSALTPAYNTSIGTGSTNQWPIGNPLSQQMFPTSIQRFPATGIGSGLGIPYPSSPPPLSPTDAKDLMEQYDHDGVLIKDGHLLFGQYMTQALRKLPLEYLVGLSRACRTLRRALILEVKRRRVIEALHIPTVKTQ